MASREVTFEVIVGGVFKFIENFDLFLSYREFIYPELFYSEDKSAPRECLRDVLKIMIERTSRMHDAKDSKEKFSKIGIRELLLSNPVISNENLDKYRKIYESWWSNEDVHEAKVDDGAFAIFIDYIKSLQFFKVSTPFLENLRTNNIAEASKQMNIAIANIGKMATVNSETLKKGEMEDMIFAESNTTKDMVLKIGNTELDNIFGGFEAQTLNGAIASTGGGKSMFCHHLLRCAIDSKMHVWIGVLEDRKKSFIRKAIACISGVDMYEFSKDANSLPEEKRKLIKEAIEKIEQYVKVDFIYDKDINAVHKHALDYDNECRLLGKPIAHINIVDYTGHISGRSTGDKMYEKMRTAYAARKDFVLKNNKIGWDFAQINREGTKSLRGNGIIGKEDLAGSFDISQVFDNIISINRGPEDVANDTCKIHVCKARDSGSGATIQVGTDFAKARYLMNVSNTLHYGSGSTNLVNMVK